MDNISKFGSKFNAAVKARSKTIFIRKSHSVRSILNLFYKAGYIFSYTSHNDSYLIFLNHRAISFNLERYSKPSVKLAYSSFKFKSLSNSGTSYIVKTPFGYQFSDSVVRNRLFGCPVYKLNFF
jgi:ribosomal protein S8